VELAGENKDQPLLRAPHRRTKALSSNVVNARTICDVVKRLPKYAALPLRLSPLSFMVTAITGLPEQEVPREDVQYLAGHSDPRTTGLYDRRRKQVRRIIVNRVPI
jgi:integrase/recombinase XerD